MKCGCIDSEDGAQTNLIFFIISLFKTVGKIMLDTLSIDLSLLTLFSCCYQPSLVNLSEGECNSCLTF